MTGQFPGQVLWGYLNGMFTGQNCIFAGQFSGKNHNYFSLILSVSPPLKLVHYGKQQVVQAIDDIEESEYAEI